MNTRKLWLCLDKDVLDIIPHAHGLYALCMADNTYAVYLRESGELWHTLAYFFPGRSWDEAIEAAVVGEISMCYGGAAALSCTLIPGAPGTSIGFDKTALRLFLSSSPVDGDALPYAGRTEVE
jgi:hypothetical protein